LRSSWEWSPSIPIGCGLLEALYIALVRPLRPAKLLLYSAGVLVLMLTLVGPLDVLGDDYLFSAHMLEHMLLLVAVPPLLLLGLTGRAARELLAWRPAAAVERVLGRPVLAWLIAVITLYAWHLPVLYNLALAHEKVHICQHLSFLVTATIFWWPILSPLPEHRLRAPTALIYLFLAGTANSVLGAVLTFTSPGLYPLYDRPIGHSTVLAFLRRDWDLDPAADQQLGGLVMWVVGMIFFLWALLAAYWRWYRESGREGTP